MKNFIIILLLFSCINLFAQVETTPEGYANLPTKPAETTISATDSVLISKTDAIVRSIAYSDFINGLGGGASSYTAGNGLNLVGFEFSLTNPITSAQLNKLDGISLGATVGADWLTNITNKPILFDGTWGSLTGIPADIADGDDNSQLTEAEVSTAFINQNPNVDLDASDDLTTNTNQSSITGQKSFVNSATGNSISTTNGSTGNGISSSNTGSGSAIRSANTGVGEALELINTGSGYALRVNNANDNGFGISVNNSENGVGIRSIGATGSTGNIYEGMNINTLTYFVNKEGNVSANSFIKTGSTSDDVLLGDGSTTSLAAISGGSGSGGMLQTTYDTNTNNIVDNAEALGGVAPSGYTTDAELTTAISAKDEADEIPVNATPVNYSSTNPDIESHLSGIDVALGLINTGGGSNNDVLTFKQPTDGYVFLPTDFDSGRLMIENYGATDLEYTLDDVASVGEKVVLSQKGAGKIQIKAGTAIVDEFQTKDNTSHITLYKASNGSYYVIGDSDIYTSPTASTNYWDTPNASNPDNEVDSTTGWSENDAVITLTSGGTQTSNGSFAVVMTQNGDGVGGFAQMNSPTALIPGGTEITLSLDLYADIGVDGLLVQFLNLTTGSAIDTNTFNGNGAFQTISHTFTPSWVGTNDIIAIVRSSDSAGSNNTAVVVVDNLKTE